jgi:photosystem II stability/assembly factor-like uncharacterized protein
MNTHAVRLIALSLALAAPFSSRAASWRVAREIKVEHSATLAAFIDDQNGITAGYAGQVFVTHDGGKTWSKAVNSSACRFGLEVLPGGAAWTAGNYGHVRVSKDGGEHWSPAASWGRNEPRQARHLSFVDAKRGLIGSQEEVAITADGGETWTNLAIPEKAGMIAAVSLSEEGGSLRIRLLDENGALWSSGDRGTTWTQAQSPVKGPVFESMTAPRAAMRFTPAGEGVLVAMVGETEPRGHVYRTGDGGKTWQEEASAELPASVVTISSDGKLLTAFDQYTIRLYRPE